jgi:hypothetical protein
MESRALPLMAAELRGVVVVRGVVMASAGCSVTALQTLETPRELNMHAHAIGVEVRSARSDRVQVVA